MDRFNRMIENIKAYYNSDSLFKASRHKFWCEIVFVTLSLEENNLIISMVQTRPCAQSCGLYRYLLWNSGRYVIEKILKNSYWIVVLLKIFTF